MAKKTAKKRVSKNRQPLLLVVTGCLLMLLGIGYHIHNASNLSFDRPVNLIDRHKSNDIPTKIVIRQIQLSLPIKQTMIKNGIWEIFNGGASHLSSSGYPNEKKPIIMYAHNKTTQFGNIDKLKEGDSIVVTTDKNNGYLYKVSHKVVVDPSNVEALKKLSGETLVLYTCVGFADTKRLLVYADRVE